MQIDDELICKLINEEYSGFGNFVRAGLYFPTLGPNQQVVWQLASSMHSEGDGGYSDTLL